MIKIVADKHLAPEHKERFLKLAKEMVECTQKEEGNISYHLHVDQKDALHMAFIEEWKDEDAIRLHNASEHFIKLVPLMAECCERPGVVTVYDVVF